MLFDGIVDTDYGVIATDHFGRKLAGVGVPAVSGIHIPRRAQPPAVLAREKSEDGRMAARARALL
eukprot:3475297-Alexandrium_andersonii.AAC.1